MRRILIVVICLCLAQALFAQKRRTAYFLKKDGSYVNIPDSAEYIRVVSEPDSGSKLYNVQEYYKSNGQTKLLGKSSKIEYVHLEGQALEYYGNGKKKFMGNYIDGKLYGQAIRYYPNGKLYAELDYGLRPTTKISDEENLIEDYRVINAKDSTGNILVDNGNGIFPDYENDNYKKPYEQGRIKNGLRDSVWSGEDMHLKVKFTEAYAAGKIIAGVGIDSAGVKHSYSGTREVHPQYKGGLNALYSYIGSNVVYPDYARANNIQGTVVLIFKVRKDGRVYDVKVQKSVEESLDNEAKRVLEGSRKWQPGSYYGIPCDMTYVIPVSFNLKG